MQLAQAVVRIREMILRGELRAGDRVAEAPLAELLGTSRTPIRQALPLLAHEGLLTEHVTRGYVVRAFTMAEIVEALELRGLLEGAAARQAAERGVTKATLRALRECLEEGDEMLAKRFLDESDEALYAELNSRFHALMIVDGAGRILTEAIARVGRIPFAAPQAVAFDRSHMDRVYDLIRYAHRQHHVIFQALERGEGARVEALVREHALTVRESIRIEQVAGGAADPRARIAMVR